MRKTNLNPVFYVYVLLDPSKPGFFQYRDSQIFKYEPIYVGKGLYGRWTHHLDYLKNNRCQYLIARKIRKIYQETGLKYDVLIILGGVFEEIAFEMEKFLIKQIGRKDLQDGPLYNLTDGGEGFSGRIFTPEQKKRNSEIQKIVQNREYMINFRKKLSYKLWGDPLYRKKHHARMNDPIIKEKCRNGALSQWKDTEKRNKLSGQNHWLYGKHHKEESREKIRKAMMGSKNHNFGKKRPHTEETKIKISAAVSGQNNPMFGRKQSEETRRKISEAMKSKSLKKKET